MNVYRYISNKVVIFTISYNCYISKVRIQNDLTIRYLMFNTDNLLLNACLGQ